MKTFKFRETLELKMDSLKPNPHFQEQTRVQKVKKRNRCRLIGSDSSKCSWLSFLAKKKKSKMNAFI